MGKIQIKKSHHTTYTRIDKNRHIDKTHKKADKPQSNAHFSGS